MDGEFLVYLGVVICLALVVGIGVTLGCLIIDVVKECSEINNRNGEGDL